LVDNEFVATVLNNEIVATNKIILATDEIQQTDIEIVDIRKLYGIPTGKLTKIKFVATDNEFVATDNEVVATEISVTDGLIIDGLKNKKGQIDGEFDNLLTANGKELSVKKRIVKKVADFETCFFKYKDQLTEDFIWDIIGKNWLHNVKEAAKQFKVEIDLLERQAKSQKLKYSKNTQNTFEFEDVQYNREGKNVYFNNRVGETVNIENN
jgi:hypothetical protein